MTKGIGHTTQQRSFLESRQHRHRHCHGGTLRNQRRGRRTRPLSTKDPLHVVFKINRDRLASLRGHRSYPLTLGVIRQYAKKFAVKLTELSVQHDHIHILLKTPKRARYQDFLRVVPGQIAQRLQLADLMLDREPERPRRRRSPVPVRGRNGEGSRRVTDTPRKVRYGSGVTDTPRRTRPVTHTPPWRGEGPRRKPGTGLWKHRPYSRVVLGRRARATAAAYVRLNEQEALGKIPYRKERLRGLSAGEWELVWWHRSDQRTGSA